MTFTGIGPRRSKTNSAAGSDFLVFPSFGESYGIAVVEAAACGLTLVISDRVGIWTEFAAANACVVAPPTTEAFAEKLRALPNHRDAAAEICGGAIECVRRILNGCIRRSYKNESCGAWLRSLRRDAPWSPRREFLNKGS